jgi:hypothetical protein
MDHTGLAQFFEKLEAEIRKGGMETVLVPPHDGMNETLRVLMPVTDEGDASLLEIMTVPYAEDADLLIFYFTVIAKINTGYEELLRILHEWNLHCPLGAFGVFDNEEQGVKQLFFKYSVPFDPELEPEELSENAWLLMTMLYDIVSRKYKEAYRITKGGD